MQVRFVDVTETSLDGAFFLAVTAVDECRASAAQDSKLPFRKRIAAPKPARSQHHFPTTIKTRYRIIGRFDGACDGFTKLRRRNFVRIDKHNPGGFQAAAFEGPVSLLRKRLKRMLVNACAFSLADFQRAIRATRIDNHDVAKATDGRQTARQIFSLVVSEDDD